MIKRLHRFHGRGSLTFLYKNGRTVRGEFLSLRYTNARQDDYRLAVVVSKKVSKKAVVRNRIRRRIYEIIRLIHIDSGKKWPVDMAITVFDDSLAKSDYQALQKAIQKLLQNAKLI
jgi:ribonuclease P protein component